MVEPATFGFNAETATTNRFQEQPEGITAQAAAAAARAEFAALARALRDAGIPLAIAPDSPEPAKPDAVFPNNWVSFHGDGTVVLYPMHDVVRRVERREAVIDEVKRQLGFAERRRIDLSCEERNGRFLEGTGSLVLDQRSRVAYACRSPRTDAALLAEWARLMDFEPFLFDAHAGGAPVYHTNVVMWLGERVAGVGMEWISEPQRAPLAARLRASGRTLLTLSDAQLRAFAGNMLEVPVEQGARRLVMSARAAASLHPSQQRVLADAGCEPLVAAVPVIEQLGGGSVRCMLAEVPLVLEPVRA